MGKAVDGGEGDHSARAECASPWVQRFLPGVAAGGTVLDLACGGGRNLRAALALGHRVTGIDRDLSRVGDLVGAERVRVVGADLETGSRHPIREVLDGQRFDGVIVTNYLWRPILPDIVERVSPGGILIYETFALGNERVGRRKPSNPDFLLKPGELLEAVRPYLVAIAFEHVTLGGTQPGRQHAGCDHAELHDERVVQRIAAVGSEHPWLAAPPGL